MNWFKKIPVIALSRFIVKYGKLTFRRLPLLILYYIRGLLMIPFATLKWLIYGNRIRKTTIDKDPVFILGHYRSGTTLLHKLMATDRRFGFPTNFHVISPNMSVLFGRPLERLLQAFIYKFRIRNFHFNDLIHELDDPSEEDMCLIHRYSPHAVYWGFIFPKDANEILFKDIQDATVVPGWRKSYMWLLKEITFLNNRRQLLLKNPPNTNRIEQLIRLFPNAKFIYLQRDPYDLYYSMLNLWKRAIVNHYSLQQISDEDLQANLFEHYRIMIRKYHATRDLIPPGNLIEIRYEELESDPYSTVRSIYQQLKLNDFNEVADALKEKIEREKKYKKFSYRQDPIVLERIQKEWGTFIEQQQVAQY